MVVGGAGGVRVCAECQRLGIGVRFCGMGDAGWGSVQVLRCEPVVRLRGLGAEAGV